MSRRYNASYRSSNEMTVANLDRPMAKRKGAGRPATSTRDDIAVNIDRTVAAQARFVADTRKIPLAEYLSESLRAIVRKDFDSVAKGEHGSK